MRLQISITDPVLASAVGGDVVLDLDVVPREGERINIPPVGELFVRTIVWYPLGDDPEEVEHPDSTPYVYLAVGPLRPGGVA